MSIQLIEKSEVYEIGEGRAVAYAQRNSDLTAERFMVTDTISSVETGGWYAWSALNKEETAWTSLTGGGTEIATYETPLDAEEGYLRFLEHRRQQRLESQRTRDHFEEQRQAAHAKLEEARRDAAKDLGLLATVALDEYLSKPEVRALVDEEYDRREYARLWAKFEGKPPAEL